ncbi:Protein transport protein yif1 [Astathelohania contejeani]|uniref:Protein YIF1 n=1 Tax=Astathelohania contejeani TaxID=164912 RepID=A0ABQ7I0J6_9MICR|nr:Protein transport protein yif1 [Thelohania contejeani]
MNLELGKGVVNAGKEYVNKEIKKMNFAKLRPYFNVTTNHILRKILLILFPFNHKDWHSRNQQVIIENERLSINDPELYLPIMGFLTYILVVGINLGLSNRFTPEMLGIRFTRAVFLEMISLALVKLAGYFLDSNDMGVFDFLSFSGYKFIIIILLILLCKIKYIGIFLKLYFYSAFFFFLSRGLKGFIIGGGSNRTKKVYFLFFTVLVEISLVFILSW